MLIRRGFGLAASVLALLGVGLVQAQDPGRPRLPDNRGIVPAGDNSVFLKALRDTRSVDPKPAADRRSGDRFLGDATQDGSSKDGGSGCDRASNCTGGDGGSGCDRASNCTGGDGGSHDGNGSNGGGCDAAGCAGGDGSNNDGGAGDDATGGGCDRAGCTATVPEPSAMILVATGVLGIALFGLVRVRRQRV